jgi:hypothetical protein
MKGSNWQTFSDSADADLTIVEIKGEHTIWDGREKPIWVTSNDSPEAVVATNSQRRPEKS